jgi:biopolymer transport protein ExbD
MSFSHKVGGGDFAVQSAINVTPLVDVVLVLLIIFMVITPLLSKNFWVHTPRQEREEIEKPGLAADPNPPLVLRIGKGKLVAVNGADVPLAELPERLKRMFAAREDHIVFFDAADEVPYGFAVEVMDKAREGGAVTIAALTTMLEATADGAIPGSLAAN